MGTSDLLSTEEWTRRKLHHQRTVDQLTAGAAARRSHGERHPVWDFMFTYYPIKPGILRRWYPGAGRCLEISETEVELPQHKDYFVTTTRGDQQWWELDLDRVWAQRGKTITYIHRLLSLTEQRPAQLGCFGLHEWAMVYHSGTRHPEPLRLGAAGTDAVVESSTIKCTHYDAFRFFTDDAVPLNQHQPTRETQPNLEQPGCLHATMDLYKWAAKLGPLLPGEVWLSTFELACDVRQLDMEASPYDLQAWGFEPVKIETPAGRAEYVRRQQALMQRGQKLRRTILEELHNAYPTLKIT